MFAEDNEVASEADNLQILSRIVSVFSRTVKNRLMSSGLNVTIKHLWPHSNIPKVRVKKQKETYFLQILHLIHYQ